MGMNLAMAGINHQPFVVRLLDERFQQAFPLPFVAPAAKTPMGVLPVTIIWRQIPPGSACAQYPEDCVDEGAVIVSIPSPRPFAPKQERFQNAPYLIRYVVASILWLHTQASSVNNGQYNSIY
jgi:hypothetical protein